MKYSEKKPAILLLEDGTVFNGKAEGLIGTSTGEICFNTALFLNGVSDGPAR